MKKSLVFLSLLICCSIFLSFNPVKKVVVIDAGHGGDDHGAVYNNAVEKEIVQKVADKIKQLNKDENIENIEIILTKSNSEQYVSLSERSTLINTIKPSLAISLHINRAGEKETDKSGQEIYVQQNETSQSLGEKLSEKLGGCYVASRKNLHLLQKTKYPTIMLELGFINNSKDREKLTSEKGQYELARQILSFIEEY